MITHVMPYKQTFVVATDKQVYLYADGALAPIRFRDAGKPADAETLKAAMERIVAIFSAEKISISHAAEAVAIARHALESPSNNP